MVSLFEHVAHALVTELIWDLKSVLCRAGKASVRCMTDSAWFASVCGIDWRLRQPIRAVRRVAKVGPEAGVSSHPHLSCLLWGNT